MRVLKFGGTSMGDEHTWLKILNIIDNYKKPVIVVSATARTTRQLVAAAERSINNLTEAQEITDDIRNRHLLLVQNFLDNHNGSYKKELQHCKEWIAQCLNRLNNLLQEINKKQTLNAKMKDAVSSIGEQLSAYLFAACGRVYGLNTAWVDATSVIKTDSSYGQAIPDKKRIRQNIHRLSKLSVEDKIPVMGGFYGEDSQGTITTLGFEGSDYTASLIGSALEAEAIEIWTDVSGIYTSDPRVVKNARPIPELSFGEATELAYFGAKVLHPSTLKPASLKGIAVFVKNIFEPDHPGTKIHGQTRKNGLAKALTYLNDIDIITVTANQAQEGHQFLAGVFDVLNKAKIPVNAVTTTEASVSVALRESDKMNGLLSSLASFGDINVEKKQGLISLIGCDFNDIKTIQNHVLNGIGDIKPTLMSYSRNKQNLNIALSETKLIPAVCRIHESLFE